MTPFATGHPTTLYYNDSIVPEGLVGAFIQSSEPKAVKTNVIIDLNYLVPLGEDFKVTRYVWAVFCPVDQLWLVVAAISFWNWKALMLQSSY